MTLASEAQVTMVYPPTSVSVSERPSLIHRSFSSTTRDHCDEPKSLPSFFKLPIAPALFEASLRTASSPAQLLSENQLSPSTSHCLGMSPERQQAFGERFHPYEKHTPYIKPKLKCVHSASGIREITCDLVAELVSNPLKLYEFGFDRLLIVDCRYEYEFTGGHIVGAVNAPHQSTIRSAVFDTLETHELSDRSLVIMHCELSRHRGPRGLKLLRKIDRELIGAARFPALHLPQIFLMTGGYREFYGKHPKFCTPSSYVPMDDPAYNDQLREVRRRHRQLDQPPKLPHSRSSRSTRSPSLQSALSFAPLGSLSRARSAFSVSDMLQMEFNSAYESCMSTTPSTPSTPILTPLVSPKANN